MTSDGRLDALFFALSDPLRRKVLEAVAQNPDATVTAICGHFPVSRFAVMRHLNVLEDAGLIERVVLGRERRVKLSDRRFEHEIALWTDMMRRHL